MQLIAPIKTKMDKAVPIVGVFGCAFAEHSARI
jgi:hypothetical protein